MAAIAITIIIWILALGFATIAHAWSDTAAVLTFAAIIFTVMAIQVDDRL